MVFLWFSMVFLRFSHGTPWNQGPISCLSARLHRWRPSGHSLCLGLRLAPPCWNLRTQPEVEIAHQTKKIRSCPCSKCWFHFLKMTPTWLSKAWKVLDPKIVFQKDPKILCKRIQVLQNVPNAFQFSQKKSRISKKKQIFQKIFSEFLGNFQKFSRRNPTIVPGLADHAVRQQRGQPQTPDKLVIFMGI